MKFKKFFFFFVLFRRHFRLGWSFLFQAPPVSAVAPAGLHTSRLDPGSRALVSTWLAFMKRSEACRTTADHQGAHTVIGTPRIAGRKLNQLSEPVCVQVDC
ncbi:hypothetical protein HHUSO_G17953 [Huso huso]|uniref:Secreted protein n=1 Tax=Huso huso TaxID=61971 RepID=A0ABR0Z626_HUSHU